MHRGKDLYGVVAAVDVSDEALARKVLKNGIYLALIRDDVFSLNVPENFQPKSFARAV